MYMYTLALLLGCIAQSIIIWSAKIFIQKDTAEYRIEYNCSAMDSIFDSQTCLGLVDMHCCLIRLFVSTRSNACTHTRTHTLSHTDTYIQTHTRPHKHSHTNKETVLIVLKALWLSAS